MIRPHESFFVAARRRKLLITLCLLSVLSAAAWGMLHTGGTHSLPDQGAQAAPPATRGRARNLALQPAALGLGRRLGQRFLKAGREVSVLEGTLTTGRDSRRVVMRRVQDEGGEQVEVKVAGRGAPIMWDAVNEKQFDRTDLANTNRLYAPGDTALPVGQRLMQYDAAGNLAVDNYTGRDSRAYDAENRMTSAQFFAGQAQTTSYVYDADGRRVKRLAGTSAEVWQIYGAGGEMLAEYTPGASPVSPQKEYGYRGGELLVTAAPGSEPQRVNVARASAGATASASSSHNAPPWVFPAAGAIDGEHRGANWSSGGGWNDATPDAYPDWL